MGEARQSRGPLWDARDLLRQGDVTGALTAFEGLLDHDAPADGAMAGIVECRLARGEAAAVAVLEPHLAASAEGGSGTAHWALASLAEVRGDHETAKQHFLAASQTGPDVPDTLPWRSGLALALARLGRSADAVPLAREHLALARASAPPYVVAQGLRTVAAVDRASDRRVLLRQALAQLNGTVAIRLHAQISTDLAGILVLFHEARGEDVVQQLHQAERVAAQHHLRPLLARVRQLLAQLDQPATQWAPSGLEGLTPSELRVADLASAGFTNREIAEQLVVTVKAVEWHLSNVYRKLGIRRRAELPR